ncbi:MerC domain-containing protein [Salinimonas iocasae]|uniref:MerC domain-containing protein n=1 Tax=Salinimonas iocasae TaxID=2572577 RepID=A0A5B7YJH1_9ALTE|nr:MerC domain-containing protein [Salinimonas iocasae]QCZ94769.1 MerC domain-containing protein [Salinimonas iocasae]
MALPTDNPSKLDKLGIWISSLCAVHCLSLPVLVPLLPLVSSTFFAQTWFERTILLFSMLIGAIALISGAVRFHGQYYPVAIISAGGLIYWHKNFLGEQFEPFTIAAGAMLIVLAHVINMRLIRKTRFQRRKPTYTQTLSSVTK